MRLIELLLRKHADRHAVNKQGKTPIDLASGEALALLQQAPGEEQDRDGGGAEGCAPQDQAAGEPAEPAAQVATRKVDDGRGTTTGTGAPTAAADTHARPKRSTADTVAVAEDSAPGKRPKVALSFDDGEEEEA